MLGILFIAGKDNHPVAGQHLVRINGHRCACGLSSHPIRNFWIRKQFRKRLLVISFANAES